MASLVREHFIAVAVNQLNGHKGDGEDGTWVASLGRRDANYFHVATAGGKLIDGMFMSGVNVDNIALLLAALKKWEAVPESDKRAGAEALADRSIPSADQPVKPPPGGLVLKVYTRNMKRNKEREFTLIEKEDLQDRKAYPNDEWRWADGIYTQPMPDVMWLTESDWKSLVPLAPRKGDSFPLPESISQRICRFYLIDGTFGLPHNWSPEEIRSVSMTLTIEEVTPVLRMRLVGKAVLASDKDLAKAHHGYDCQVSGHLVFDPKIKAFTTMDILALGDCWGGDWEGGRFARPGRAPLGIAFELAKGDAAADRIPPKGIRYRNLVDAGYFK